ncbi:MAG: DNA mismatch repair endonuclease MutL [Thermodesulfovibrio sp.]|nr:DNA mismatch repair endonuclease MutL [Thermodesulfovibrio sp.]
MVRIKILPELLVGKIAAGEVIERPASALKELIENSIDASAKSIHVYVKEYGLAEIKVVDDGEGITSEDVTLAFQRHATSKIEKEEDIFNIHTLGFRGEALYSIAQVSKLRIITQHREEDIGTELYLIGGKIVEKKPAVTRGTTVEIKDLFFNTPVRKKFLKSPFTEKAHLIETVQNYALAYPKVSFYLNIDGQEILNIPVASFLRDRILQVFSLEFTEKLKFMSISKDGYKLELFWGGEELSRKQRAKQLVFVNRRPVRDSLIVSTLYKAFKVKENHPQFLFFLTMPSEAVDFNVHPAKKEVRFRETGKITELIFRTVEIEKPSFIAENTAEWESDLNPSFSFQQSSFFETQPAFDRQEVLQFINLGDAIVALQQPEGILFIDFHAAHERVNFEKILNLLPENTIRLVFPQVISLNPQEYALLKGNLHLLNELHIEAEDFGENSVVIRSIPEILKDADIAGIVESIAVTIKEEAGKPDFNDIREKIAATIACHSSLRSNNRINPYELKILLQELELTSDSEHCPHGRPIKKFLSFNEIKKWFFR